MHVVIRISYFDLVILCFIFKQVQFSGLKNTVKSTRQKEVAWSTIHRGKICNDAVQGNYDFEASYVCQAEHHGNLLPGELKSASEGCLILYAQREIKRDEYKVLCGRLHMWVQINEKVEDMLKQAFPAGKAADGTIYYVCRAHFQERMFMGKISSTENVCFFSHGGQEHQTNNNFDVLVV